MDLTTSKLSNLCFSALGFGFAFYVRLFATFHYKYAEYLLGLLTGDIMVICPVGLVVISSDVLLFNLALVYEVINPNFTKVDILFIYVILLMSY